MFSRSWPYSLLPATASMDPGFHGTSTTLLAASCAVNLITSCPKQRDAADQEGRKASDRCPVPIPVPWSTVQSA